MRFTKRPNEIDLVDYANKNILIAEEEPYFLEKREFTRKCILELQKLDKMDEEIPKGFLSNLEKLKNISLNSWLYYSSLVSKLEKDINRDARGRQKFIESFCKSRDDSYNMFVKVTRIVNDINEEDY